MKISGITTCVGDVYVAAFAESLPIWKRTLDEIIVMTQANQPRVHSLCHKYNVTAVSTEAFSPRFNKGAALNQAWKLLTEPEWLLSLDCDVLPPSDWRKKCENVLVRDNLHGVQRTGNPARKVPFGYFQLWRFDDIYAKPFNEQYDHAGYYDRDFAHNWPIAHWRWLPFTVKHSQATRHNWFGPDSQAMTRAMLKKKNS